MDGTKPAIRLIQNYNDWFELILRQTFTWRKKYFKITLLQHNISILQTNPFLLCEHAKYGA